MHARTAMLLCLLGASAALRAEAHELELGGFGGGRFFSEGNELGRLDQDPRSPGNAPQHSGTVGLGVGYAPHPRVAVEAELALIPTTTRDGQAMALLFAYRGQALVHILTGRLRPFVLIGGGATSSVYSADTRLLNLDTDGLLHGGVGAKLDLGRGLVLRLDSRVLFPPRIEDSLFTQDFEVLVGLYGRLALRRRPAVPPDPDGDGVRGAADRCPAQPEDRDGFRDDDGCPDPDNDGDGVPDGADRCRDQAGPKDGGGCPDRDGDNDGVVDRLDACPERAGAAEDKGCPPPDRDGDGVPDGADRCPDHAGPAPGAGGAGDPVQGTGCPDQDGDAVPDPQDRCPAQPETRNGFQDDDGCPDGVPREVARLAGPVRVALFKPGTHPLARPALRVLKEAARILREHPSVRLEIRVSSERGGDARKAFALAQRRADVLKRYLVEQGIAEARLGAVALPPAPARVELRILIEDLRRTP